MTARVTFLTMPFLFSLVLFAGCGQADDPNTQTLPSGLKYVDVEEGKGEAAKKGDSLIVHYSGALRSGKVFDSSYNRREPFRFNLGRGEVIKGWDEGVAGMKVGGRRKLIIPSNLGYGERGAGKDIPPNAELRFDIELMEIISPDTKAAKKLISLRGPP